MEAKLKFFHKRGFFDLSQKTFVMGIINVTPDSFSDHKNCKKQKSIDEVLYLAQQMERDGADLLDIGGESTRPGFTPIPAEEEIARVLPAIEKIRQNTSLPISVDTTKSEVAKLALEAGADIINDIWGAAKDPNMLNVIKQYNAGFIAGHNRECTGDENSVIFELEKFFDNLLQKMNTLKISEKFLCIDPNIGFAKTYQENIKIIKELSFLSKFNLPTLIGVSRKSIIGKTLNLPVEKRLEGSLALAVICALKGINFIRVHDVKETVRALKMTDKIIRW